MSISLMPIWDWKTPASRIPRKIVDVRFKEKCGGERQIWDEELNVCIVDKPEDGVGYVINQPDFETYDAEDEWIKKLLAKYGERGIRNIGYYGPDDDEIEELVEEIDTKFGADVDDMHKMCKGETVFFVIYSWPAPQGARRQGIRCV